MAAIKDSPVGSPLRRRNFALRVQRRGFADFGGGDFVFLDILASVS